MDWLRFSEGIVMAFVGSGLAGGVITLYIKNRYAKQGREATYLKAQLEKLYGPLMFRIKSVDLEGEHMGELMGLGNKLYGGISPDEEVDPGSQPHELQVVINECGMDMLGHCMEMVNTLKENYAYIDPDDIDVFGALVRNRRRWLSVFGEDGILRINDETVRNMLEIPTWYDKEVWERVTGKFLAKQKRLRELGG